MVGDLVQGFKGIRQWPINCTSPNDDTQNNLLCTLQLMLNGLTLNLMNQPIKV